MSRRFLRTRRQRFFVSKTHSIFSNRNASNRTPGLPLNPLMQELSQRSEERRVPIPSIEEPLDEPSDLNLALDTDSVASVESEVRELKVDALLFKSSI